ncbi:hypothetical protein [Streptomyces sp. NBC_00859]|uniref:hypothetical protein n=1 Tax=Streptomyces sp. NBC_00859 TaxID=2903682 RepID=UPI00386DC4CC|nr:hypothetical protein OG584_22875 [Streptomyces sp. NBC_00859]
MRLRSALATVAAPAAVTPALAALLLTGAPPATAQSGAARTGAAQSITLRSLAARKATVRAAALLARASSAPGCADRDDSAFPVEARIHGGPTSYVTGGDFDSWTLRLTNTSDRLCRDIHPVVAIVDRGRKLQDRQIRMEFDDPGAHRWRPVPFTTTDEDEHIGPFGDGAGGFDVPAGRTVSVAVRLAFAGDTTPDDVTADAAVVRRHGDDGDWVGDSGDYRFSVTADPPVIPPAAPSADPTRTDVPGERVPGERIPGRVHDGVIGGRAGVGPEVGPRTGAHRFPGELARTGRPHRLRTLGTIACTCVLLGAALVVGSRRPRIQRRR